MNELNKSFNYSFMLKINRTTVWKAFERGSLLEYLYPQEGPMANYLFLDGDVTRSIRFLYPVTSILLDSPSIKDFDT